MTPRSNRLGEVANNESAIEAHDRHGGGQSKKIEVPPPQVKKVKPGYTKPQY
jgi:hypothetical protein